MSLFNALSERTNHETSDIGRVALTEYPRLRFAVRILHVVDLDAAGGFQPPPFIEDTVAGLGGLPLTDDELGVVIADTA